MAARRLPLPLPLLVIGAALVVAGLRVAPDSAAASSGPLAYVPPTAATAMAPDTTKPAVRVVPVRRPRTHAAGHQAARSTASHRTSSRPPSAAPAPPAAAASSSHPVATTRKPPASVRVIGPTSWSALNAAIARIPSYRSGTAHWVVSTKYDFWGTADWYHDVLYVDPSVPVDKLYDVAVHEWSHELSVLDYGGDVATATRAMNAAFGGSGLTGAERAADCMAILQGARWTHYTTCTDARWRAAASRLVAGKQLP
jgi:hypothetical protein